MEQKPMGMKVAKRGTASGGPYYATQDERGWGVALKDRIVLHMESEARARETADLFNGYVAENKIK